MPTNSERTPLNSWKEISAYLKRSERTVQRWEKEGLPVRRFPDSKSGTVFAYPEELDDWLRSRLSEPAEPAESATPTLPPTEISAAPKRTRRDVRWAIAAIVLVAVVVIGWVERRRLGFRPPPVETIPLTSFEGSETCPTFSPDAKRVAFVWRKLPNKGEIYTIAPGDPSPFRLTDSTAEEFSPAWSPDGNTIAFIRRSSPTEAAIILKPAAGGQERKLAAWPPPNTGLRVEDPVSYLDWMPDSRSLVVSMPVGDGAQLVRVSIDDGQSRVLTTPPKGQRDVNPAVAPGGREVAFVRVTGVIAMSLRVLSLAPDGEPGQLREVDPPGLERSVFAAAQWSPDGRELVFSSDWGGSFALWRGEPFSGHSPVRLEGATFPADRNSFAISRDGQRLVYTDRNLNMNVWSLDVSGTKPPKQLTTGSRINYFGRYSHEGDRIVYGSNRTGAFQIWIADGDGANGQVITAIDQGTSGSPSWSPDGKWIVFDSRLGANSDIYKVASKGGPVIRLTSDPAGDTTPIWSGDSRGIYFCSNRSGRDEVWRIAADGGTALQVTHTGGAFPLLSPQGDRIFFLKEQGQTSVWSMKTDGSDERQEEPSITGRAFVPGRDGLYFLDGTRIQYREFRSKHLRSVGSMPKRLLPEFDLSPDGHTLLLTQIDNVERDLILIDRLSW